MRNLLSLILFIFLFNLFSADKEATALNINLQKGWNLVSVHVDSDEPVESYMAGRLYVDGSLVSDVSSVIRRIWSYEGNWFSYPGGASNVLTHFKPGQGYWFYVAEAATINIGDTIQYNPNMPAPGNFNAFGGDGQITLGWSPIGGVTEYRIYRKSSSGVSNSDTREIVVGGDTNSHTIINLENGTAYYFKIEAWNALGTSVLSEEITATPSEPILFLMAEPNLTIDGTNAIINSVSNGRSTITSSNGSALILTSAPSMITLTRYSGHSVNEFVSTNFYMRWEKANDDYIEFNIRNALIVESDNIFKMIFTTDSKLDASNVKAGYGYTIHNQSINTEKIFSSIDANHINLNIEEFLTWVEIISQKTGLKQEVESYFGSYPCTMTIRFGNVFFSTEVSERFNEMILQNMTISPPNTPGNLNAANGNAQVTLNWTAVNGATEYRVYYKSSSGVTTSNIHITVSGGSSNFGTITGLTNGTTYYFCVQAINAGGSSILSSEVSATPQVPAPSTPTSITAASGKGLVTVSWDAVSGATEYNIYYDTSAGVDTSDYFITLSGESTTSANITGLGYGQSYYFKVEAKNPGGVSSLSDEVSATTLINETRIASIGMDLVLIPSGNVNRPNLTPSSITMDNDFYLGKYPVTQAQWVAVMGADSWPGNSPDKGTGDNYPMYNVSWDDIIQQDGFLDRLNDSIGCTGLTGTGAERYNPISVPEGCFRLPTANELEYAQRGRSTDSYYWGSSEELSVIDHYAWYQENDISSNIPESYPSGTKPVGLKTPNFWSLYDINGNVWQWTYSPSGLNKIAKGGGWNSSVGELKSFSQTTYSTGTRANNLGFRVFRVLPVLVTAAPTGFSGEGGYNQVTLNWGSINVATGYKIYYKSSSGVSLSDNFITINGGSTTSTVMTLLEDKQEYYFRILAFNKWGDGQLSNEIMVETLQLPIGIMPNIEMIHIPTTTTSAEFHLGKYPVTQGQWKAVMGSNPSHFSSCGDDCPVEQVSWIDIVEGNQDKDGLPSFLDRLNELAGCTGLVGTGVERYNPAAYKNGFPPSCYRLPTADESEYAHRAGTETSHYWGESDDLSVVVSQYAWYSSNSGNKTHPVGLKEPNPWGLYDMSGNVWEWTFIDSASLWIRGGSWDNSVIDLRSACLLSRSSGFRDSTLGLRLLYSSAPTGINATGSDKQATVTWSAVKGATEYRIYNKTAPGVTTNDLFETVSGGDTTSYTFTNLISGIMYFFRVEAWNILGASSLSSEIRILASDLEVKEVQGIELVRIYPGTFMMGSPDGVGESRERPQHQVTISNDFYIGKYEVTQKQWSDVIGTWTGSFSYGMGYNYPVYNVRWIEITGVNGFLDNLNQTVGCDISNLPTDNTRYHPANVPAGCFRLPTEAEWEYAARAGSTTNYYWGDNDTLADIELYVSRHSDSGISAVGEKIPNAWGLYDMSGNVREWVYDWYGDYNGGSTTDPVNYASGSDRMLRGGGWYDDAGYLRSAYRFSYAPDGRGNDFGFRLVLVAEQP